MHEETCAPVFKKKKTHARGNKTKREKEKGKGKGKIYDWSKDWTYQNQRPFGNRDRSSALGRRVRIRLWRNKLHRGFRLLNIEAPSLLVPPPNGPPLLQNGVTGSAPDACPGGGLFLPLDGTS